MDDTLFNELLASTKEAKEILATKTTPSRTFYIDEPNTKEIRSKFSLNSNKFWKYFRCKK